MKALLILMALLEAGTGVALAVSPSAVVRLLLGTSLDSTAGVVLGRMLGAALFAIGAACWAVRDDARGRTASGLILAILPYHIAVVSLLSHARLGLEMTGIGLWPVVIIHAALAVWCVAIRFNLRGG